MSSVMLGATPKETPAEAQKKIDEFLAARKAGAQLSFKVGTSDGRVVEIKDPAKQQEFLARSRIKPSTMVIDEMIAEAKAGPKKTNLTPILAIAGAAAAAYFLMR